MSERKITVLTAFYNSEEFIERTIRSVLNQSYKNWEWICVDDCSRDRTVNILRKYADKDSRIKVIEKTENGGNAAKSFNYGLKYCTGTHIQILGHDDEITPDTLDEIVKRADETEADIIIPDAEFVNDLCEPGLANFKMIGVMSSEGWEKTPENRDIILSGKQAVEYSIAWRIHAWCATSAKIIRECGGWVDDVMNGDEYSARLFFLKANKVVFSKGTYRYLRRPDSISMKLNAKSFDIFLTEKRLIKLLTENYFDKDVIDKSRNELLNKYFYALKRYDTHKEEFSKEDINKIKQYLNDGFKAVLKYSSKKKLFVRLLKHYKYCFLLFVWKKLGKKLKKKGYI